MIPIAHVCPSRGRGILAAIGRADHKEVRDMLAVDQILDDVGSHRKSVVTVKQIEDRVKG